IYGAIRNKNGKMCKATPHTVSMAGAGAVEAMNGGMLSADLWDQPGDEAYPAAAFTYLLVYKDLNNLKTREQAQALARFLWWAVHDGQKFAPELDYSPLAPGVVTKVEAALRQLTYKGEPLLPATR